MRSIVALACLVAVASPTVAAAQARLNLSFSPATETESPRRPLTMPVTDYVSADGRLQLRRGVVVGVDISPQTSFGLGIFEGAPKRRLGAPDPAKPERRSKRAAVGFSLKF